MATDTGIDALPYRLILGDCLERLRTIEAGSVDLILTDLPYGTTACKWDSVIPFEPLWACYKRVLKPRGAVVLTSSQPFTSLLVASNVAWFRYEWIWEKQKSTGFLYARRRPLKAHENILVFYGELPTYNPQGVRAGRPNSGADKNRRGSLYDGGVPKPGYVGTQVNFPRSVLKIPAITNNQIHPTQKPVALMEYLIRTYTNEDETVLDSCMGSGSTGVGCINTNRRFIGIERDPDYFKIAEDRLQKASCAGGLFACERGEDPDAPDSEGGDRAGRDEEVPPAKAVTLNGLNGVGSAAHH